MKSLFASLVILSASAAGALAHPGHVLDAGQGHSHISGYAALGLAAIGLAGLLAQKIARRRRARLHG